ncbi:MAG: prepilin peptidase [Verrucomicrobiota bacterium]|jgi:leader peptidase (prepilin peptidase)/N-methyltransferase|nr:prepilin peptidase [Verrucomicrobiota bacterium]
MNGPPELYLFLSAFIFLGGLCIGSFLNVCIWRIPRDESIVWPGSHCPACRHALAPWDNIPLASWLMLNGKCRYCAAPISPRYFLVELLTGALFTWIWLIHGWSVLTPLYFVFTSALIVGTFIDFDHLILPDRITIGGMMAGPLLSVLFPVVQGQQARLTALWQSCLGLALGYGLLWLVATLGRAILKREAMGFGDVKLLGAIGACMGWQAVLFTVLISSLSGTLLGLLFVAIGKKEMQSRIPYGPHLALAAGLWMLYGPAWVAAYVRWATGGLL